MVILFKNVSMKLSMSIFCKTARISCNSLCVYWIPFKTWKTFYKFYSAFAHGESCGGKSVCFVYIGSDDSHACNFCGCCVLFRIINMQSSNGRAWCCNACAREVDHFYNLVSVEGVANTNRPLFTRIIFSFDFNISRNFNIKIFACPRIRGSNLSE